MYKSVDVSALNSVVVTGSLLGLDVREGKSKKTGRTYRSANAVVRVNQRYGGQEEISEIPLRFIANKFKNDNTSNPVFDLYANYDAEYKTAERNGLENATTVTVNGLRGNGSLSENMFADPRNPENVLSSWTIRCMFLNEVRNASSASGADCATFDLEIFIMGMEREVNASGEETGRLKIRGGIVQYGRKLDILDFYVENPEGVDYIERNFSVNDTAHVVGRIRYTSVASTYTSTSSWGEAIPKTNYTKKHELIITTTDPEPLPEERAYDPEEIRVLVADRNNRKEQAKIDARSEKAAKAAASAAPKEAPVTAKYEWED